MSLNLLPCLMLGLGLVLAAAAAAPRPNILFIMTDDHAAHAIGAYGSKINQTPHMDRLAARDCGSTVATR